MKNALENYERLSAFADGQWLEGEGAGADEAKQTLDWLVHDGDAQARWNNYHLLGDVMRLGPLACPEREAAFMQRMNAALAQESEKTEQSVAIKKGAGYARHHWLKHINVIKKSTANDAVFNWRLAGCLASVLAVLVVAWQGVSLGFESGSAPQIAQVSAPLAPTTAPMPQLVAGDAAATMLRDPQLDAFLAAHKQFGGTSALQKPAGFLSNAVFEGSAR